jgi:hypothetical protein
LRLADDWRRFGPAAASRDFPFGLWFAPVDPGAPLAVLRLNPGKMSQPFFL